MPFLPLVLLATLLSPECSAAPAAAQALELRARATGADSVVRVAVCVNVPVGRRIGSYHGELTYESHDARLVRVEKPADGMRVENTTVAGSVNFAAAAPSGLGSGMLITVVLAPVRGDTVPRVKVCLLEVNDTRGESLLPPHPCIHS